MSNTNVYTTSTLIVELLPSDYSTTILTTAKMTANIAKSSRMTDSFLPNYWPFQDVAGTPATPGLINRLATVIGAMLGLDTLQMSDRSSEDSIYQRYAKEADQIIGDLRSGESVIQETSISSEALTFGGTGYNSDLAPLGSAETEIIPKSVEIGTDEWGVDFTVYFSEEHRRYVVKRIATLSAATASYNYSLLKRREKQSNYGNIPVYHG